LYITSRAVHGLMNWTSDPLRKAGNDVSKFMIC